VPQAAGFQSLCRKRIPFAIPVLETIFPRAQQIRLGHTLMILVTVGAGFIGSNFVLDWLSACAKPVTNLEKLT
jgi:hypothetical protein